MSTLLTSLKVQKSWHSGLLARQVRPSSISESAIFFKIILKINLEVWSTKRGPLLSQYILRLGLEDRKEKIVLDMEAYCVIAIGTDSDGGLGVSKPF